MFINSLISSHLYPLGAQPFGEAVGGGVEEEIEFILSLEHTCFLLLNGIMPTHSIHGSLQLCSGV